mgnify:FL=1
MKLPRPATRHTPQSCIAAAVTGAADAGVRSGQWPRELSDWLAQARAARLSLVSQAHMQAWGIVRLAQSARAMNQRRAGDRSGAPVVPTPKDLDFIAQVQIMGESSMLNQRQAAKSVAGFDAQTRDSIAGPDDLRYPKMCQPMHLFATNRAVFAQVRSRKCNVGQHNLSIIDRFAAGLFRMRLILTFGLGDLLPMTERFTHEVAGIGVWA